MYINACARPVYLLGNFTYISITVDISSTKSIPTTIHTQLISEVTVTEQTP